MRAARAVKLLALLAALAVLAPARSLAARERLAVFVAVDGEPALAENLSEVTIAKLAGSGEFELVGAGELEATARDIPTVRAEGLAACFELPACLAEVGIRAQTKRAVLGRVTRDDAEYSLELALVHTGSFQTDRKEQRRAPGDIASLIGALQAAAEELVKPAPALDTTAPRTEIGASPAPGYADAPPAHVLMPRRTRLPDAHFSPSPNGTPSPAPLCTLPWKKSADALSDTRVRVCGHHAGSR